jgi:uncharacterized membrane protein
LEQEILALDKLQKKHLIPGNKFYHMTLEAREALEYALSKDMLHLYGVILSGYIALIVAGWFGTNWAVLGGTAGIIGQLLTALLFLGGFATAFTGLVAFIYKLVSDATGAE